MKLFPETALNIGDVADAPPPTAHNASARAHAQAAHHRTAIGLGVGGGGLAESQGRRLAGGRGSWLASTRSSQRFDSWLDSWPLTQFVDQKTQGSLPRAASSPCPAFPSELPTAPRHDGARGGIGGGRPGSSRGRARQLQDVPLLGAGLWYRARDPGCCEAGVAARWHRAASCGAEDGSPSPWRARRPPGLHPLISHKEERP
mmetsp:Transcript_5990/g.20422  ORF Transcript_5990/g.20422 Transcript_5990/m.20422 type:complete len:202 (+) Transcript_5990:1458-2063(+)